MHVRCVPFPFPFPLPFPRRTPSARPRRSLRGLLLLPSPRRHPLPRTLPPSLFLSPSPAAVSGRRYLAAGPLPALSHAPSLPLVAPSAASVPCQFPRRHRLSSSPPAVGIRRGVHRPRTTRPARPPHTVLCRTTLRPQVRTGPYAGSRFRRSPHPPTARRTTRTNRHLEAGNRSPMAFRAIDPPHGSRQLHGIHFADINVPLFHF